MPAPQCAQNKHGINEVLLYFVLPLKPGSKTSALYNLPINYYYSVQFYKRDSRSVEKAQVCISYDKLNERRKFFGILLKSRGVGDKMRRNCTSFFCL